MGAIVFSDVHADSVAIRALGACIKTPLFKKEIGQTDMLVNLGDLVHRGDRPQETLETIYELGNEYRLVSVMGNHDHAYVNRLLVSGSDPASTYRHEILRGSPLLSIFDTMPMEWSHCGMLCVHGGPLELGNQTLRLKCWQRLSYDSGDSFAGFHYTAAMAFEALEAQGLKHMCCGHQHHNICCRKTEHGITRLTLSHLLQKMMKISTGLRWQKFLSICPRCYVWAGATVITPSLPIPISQHSPSFV